MLDQRTPGADQGSAFPHRAGVPWWGAVLIAVVATLIGFAIEAGSGGQELGTIFALCYALGCIAAVLAVRQSGLFTTVIQPPLLLFVAVPLAYFLLHGSAFNGLKDIAISCGYPLVERFPLMLFTSAAVLLIGLVRWYLAMAAPARPQAAATLVAPERTGLLAGLTARLSSAFAGNGAEAEETDRRSGRPPARPRHGVDRSATARRPRPDRQPRERTSAGSGRSRSRRGDAGDAQPRPRRESVRRPARDDDRTMEAPRRMREPREPREPRRTPPPPRREPREYRDYRDQYPPRSGRGRGYESAEPGRGYPPRPAYDPYPPQGPRRRPAPATPPTDHHPVSRVRYRDSAPEVDYPDFPRNRPVR